MNVELSTTQTNTTNEAKASSTNVTNSVKDSSKSFKEELTKKADESKTSEQKVTDTKVADAKVAEEQTANNVAKDKVANNPNINTDTLKGHENLINTDDKDRKNILKTARENTEVLNSISELNNEIENINKIKIGSLSSKTSNLKTEKLEKTENMPTMKMNEADAMFFINLVENKDMNVQNVQQQINNQTQNVTTVVQTQEAQKPMPVTQTLLDKLSDSMNTNKPFRIDFDNDIAVIMKVNPDGSLTANFIPGSSAVENYLRNNIASLRQSFDEQELSYGELTYSNQKDERRKGQQNKEKGNE